ncbi:hypothetical protein L195_g062245, partial [Trifolium pratense]
MNCEPCDYELASTLHLTNPGGGTAAVHLIAAAAFFGLVRFSLVVRLGFWVFLPTPTAGHAFGASAHA